VISGSFRKHLKEISKLKKALERYNIQVLSPEVCEAVNPKDEFTILGSDPVDSPELLQPSIFQKIRESTFLVVANFGGYLGAAATLEIGYSIAIGIKIYALETITDPNIAPFCTSIFTVFPELKEELREVGEGD
jgi:nucleoside 2-deoxyribosyltransferase